MTDSVEYYNSKGLRTITIPYNKEKPKALKKKGWQHLPTELDIPEARLFGVIMTDEYVTIDIDEPELNKILDEKYLAKTLVVETGNGGRHYYFKDQVRLEEYKIKIGDLMKGGVKVGDIKAAISYVVGYGRSYTDHEDEGKTKTYSKISSTDEILETDVYDILQILKDNGITKKGSKETNQNAELQSMLQDGLDEGSRNNTMFKQAMVLLEKGISVDGVKDVLDTANKKSKDPLPETEIEAILQSASGRLKEMKTSRRALVQQVTEKILKEKQFSTMEETEEILIYNGKIYGRGGGKAFIKQRAEEIIYNNSTGLTNEIVAKIQRKTFVKIDEFDSNPDEIVLDSGILDIKTMKQSDFTPEKHNLIQLPLSFTEPKFPIRNSSIFDDLEKNLKDTLFWQYLVRSHTIDGKLKKKHFQSSLEMLASVFVKQQIDETAFILMGKGKNGKSVLLDYIVEMVGKDNVAHESLQKLATDRFSAVKLLDKIANIVGDLDSDEMKTSGIIKDLITGSGVSVEWKGKDKFDLYNKAKLLFSLNQFPRANDQTDGFFRRWIIIPWDRQFENDAENDPQLKSKLYNNREEMNVVFSSMIYLSAKLLSENKFSHKLSISETRELWNENSDPLQNYIDECIATVKDESHERRGIREVYDHYKGYCAFSGVLALRYKKFSAEFEEYYDQGKVDGFRYWECVGFKEPVQELMDRDST